MKLEKIILNKQQFADLMKVLKPVDVEESFVWNSLNLTESDFIPIFEPLNRRFLHASNEWYSTENLTQKKYLLREMIELISREKEEDKIDRLLDVYEFAEEIDDIEDMMLVIRVIAGFFRK